MPALSPDQRVADQYAAMHSERSDEYTLADFIADAPTPETVDRARDILAVEYREAKLTDDDIDLDSGQPSAAIAWMLGYDGTFEYVHDVRRRWLRYGTIRVAGIRGLLNTLRAEVLRDPAYQPFEAEPEPVQAAAFKAVIDLLTMAQEKGLKKPRLHLNSHGSRITIKPAPATGRNAGSYYVTAYWQRAWRADDGGGEAEYYGKIDAAGTADAKLQASPVYEVLQDMARDPLAFAVRQGRETICCMFCGRDLDTTESRTVGYGPICARRFGLPWGRDYD